MKYIRCTLLGRIWSCKWMMQHPGWTMKTLTATYKVFKAKRYFSGLLLDTLSHDERRKNCKEQRLGPQSALVWHSEMKFVEMLESHWVLLSLIDYSTFNLIGPSSCNKHTKILRYISSHHWYELFHLFATSLKLWFAMYENSVKI